MSSLLPPTLISPLKCSGWRNTQFSLWAELMSDWKVQRNMFEYIRLKLDLVTTRGVIQWPNLTSDSGVCVVSTAFQYIYIQTKRYSFSEDLRFCPLSVERLTGMSRPAPKSEPGPSRVLWEYSSVSPVTTKDGSAEEIEKCCFIMRALGKDIQRHVF